MPTAIDTDEPQYPGGLYVKPDQSKAVVKSGTTLQIDGGLDFSTAATFAADGVQTPLAVTFSAAAGGANVCEVTITVVDGAGTAIASVFNLDIWLSDAATGAGYTSTSASGTVQAKSASGADLEVMSAKKGIRAQTLATGIYILEITDSAKTGFYVCAALPMTGAAQISDQLVTGDYGS